jgi:predicted TIM-barrel enzyme
MIEPMLWGVIQGVGHLTMRLPSSLRSNVLVFADDLVDGFVVGRTFKEAGNANKFVAPARVSNFITAIKTLRASISI